MLNQTDIQLESLFKIFIHECTYSSCRSSATIRGYEAVFKLFLVLVPEAQSLNTLNSELLTEFFKRLQLRERKVGNSYIATGVMGTTILTYRSKLYTFFTWLHINGHIKSNPLASIPIPKVSSIDKTGLTEFDVRRLYSTVTLHSKNTFLLRRDTVMLSILYFTGVRLGEFISLEIKEVDLVNHLITIKGNTSKSKRQRQIPIHPTLLFHLTEYLKELKERKYTCPYLIVSTSQNKGLSLHGLKHWVNNLSNKSRVRFHLHQFRHAFACNLASNNVSAVKIQKLLGHSSLNMTMHYLKGIDSKNLIEDICKLSI